MSQINELNFWVFKGGEVSKHDLGDYIRSYQMDPPEEGSYAYVPPTKNPGKGPWYVCQRDTRNKFTTDQLTWCVVAADTVPKEFRLRILLLGV